MASIAVSARVRKFVGWSEDDVQSSIWLSAVDHHGRVVLRGDPTGAHARFGRMATTPRIAMPLLAIIIRMHPNVRCVLPWPPSTPCRCFRSFDRARRRPDGARRRPDRSWSLTGVWAPLRASNDDAMPFVRRPSSWPLAPRGRSQSASAFDACA